MIDFIGVSKHFPGVRALSDVSFRVERGACHALLGENGAGKSTLGKILAGIYRPDAGEIRLDGRPVSFASPREAMAAGVGIVHQELLFCSNLSVAENLLLHDLPRRGLTVDQGELRRRARLLLAEIGLELDVDQPISKLSIGQEQMVQIAAAVGLGARVLVFDEPTSSLARGEVEKLFALIRRLQAGGVTILYVSHRLEEIFELCQSVTVLRDGRHVATRPTADVDHDELVRLMVGRAVESYVRKGKPPTNAVAAPVERLQLRNFSLKGKFENVNLAVQAGEIVALAGLVGAGRTELVEAIFGLSPGVTGEISIDGARVRVVSPREAMNRGIGLVPEDRKRSGLILPMTIRENLTLPILDRFRRALGRADRGAEQALAEQYRRKLSIRTPNVETAAQALSGGNQQKIVMAKGMIGGGRILLIDEPTRGVDVGAKREIHDTIAALSAEGAAILLISSDLPELLALADRVVVLRSGRVAAELSRTEATPETVLRHMAGLATANA